MAVKMTKIPKKDMDEIISRDVRCVYCDKKLIYPWDLKNRKDSATTEHFNYKKNIDSVGDCINKNESVSRVVGKCCGSCNSSRRDNKLTDWFEKDYCRKREKPINIETVAQVVRDYIEKYEK